VPNARFNAIWRIGHREPPEGLRWQVVLVGSSLLPASARSVLLLRIERQVEFRERT
jgi:hypothetical protein